MNKLKGDRRYVHYISGYCPNSFLKPILIFSGISDIEKNSFEIAVAPFGALDIHHALSICYADQNCYDRAGWGKARTKYNTFKAFKKFKSISEGLKYFQDLSHNMNWKSYNKFLSDNNIPFEDKDRLKKYEVAK